MIELTLIQIDYYYRYVLVCRNNVFSNARFFTCVGIACSVSVLQTTISFFAMDYGPSRDPYIRKVWAMAKDSLDIGYKSYPFGIVNGELPKMLFSGLTSMTIICVVYGIVIFCTLKIRETLRENAKRRQKKESKRTATQVTRVMILQAVSPFIFFALPSILVTIASFVNLNTKILGVWITLNLYWSPAIKAIGTIYIMTPFRRALLKKLIPSKYVPATSLTTSKDDSLVRTQSQPLPISSTSNNELSTQVFL
ncbi:hypothetical protein M3Y97_00593300 [Aphelenchoides bicaudatus]|nr:hypothetical protein M3Y97_00593300 [Aphelenchoides bicaudatus]